MILLDTSGLFAALVDSENEHGSALRVLEGADAMVVSPFVLAELDYLLERDVGVDAEVELLADIARGSYELAGFGADDVAAATALIAQYRDLGIGLADASIAVLADKLGTTRVLTLDERHFRALRTPAGRTLTLLPADA